jgi:hypothetical protein
MLNASQKKAPLALPTSQQNGGILSVGFYVRNKRLAVPRGLEPPTFGLGRGCHDYNRAAQSLAKA